jgi:hypothetical protein
LEKKKKEKKKKILHIDSLGTVLASAPSSSLLSFLFVLPLFSKEQLPPPFV